MASEQTTLGDDSGIAEELADNQREISIAEFFEKNKQMLGFDSKTRSIVTAVKEAVDNALDATEEAGYMPDLYVEIQDNDDYYTLIVEDNGPGLPKENIPKVFGKLLYGSRFHAREQSRGQQGIGISAAVLYGQMTSGNPARITSRPEGSDTSYYYELIIDTDRNEPDIRVEKETTWERQHGTRIELDLAANMRGRKHLRDYIKYTAVVNPHARLTFKEPGLDEAETFERAENAELPAATKEIPPHPHGVTLGALQKMLQETDSYSVSGFLKEEFTRVGSKTAENILNNFRDLQYGREASWSAGIAGQEAIKNGVTGAVMNKTKTELNAFADQISTRITEEGRVSHGQLTHIVNDVAEDVEDGFTTRFGSTVRTNTIDALWPLICQGRLSTIRGIVDEATSQRKTAETKQAFSERLAEKFSHPVTVADGEEPEYLNDDNPSDRLTRTELEDYVNRAADMTEEMDDTSFGDTSRGNIIDALWDTMQTVNDDVPNVTKLAGVRDMERSLVEAMQVTKVNAPPSDCLSPITSELIETGLKKEFPGAEFYSASTRKADVHGGDPFIAEAGIAYGGDLDADGTAELLRFANRVPLVYQQGGCLITKVCQDIGWRNYKLSQSSGSLPNGPIVIMASVASTNVPFTSESKDAVADNEAIRGEVELAVREAARELKDHLVDKKKRRERQEKENVLVDILPDMAEKVTAMTGRSELNIDGALARIMNNIQFNRDIDSNEVTLTLTSHENSGSDSITITEIVNNEPTDIPDDVNIVEMDGEWFIKWEINVSSGSEHELTYRVPEGTDFDVQVEGIPNERLTITN